MRDKVFEESEEQLIDIYDVKVNYFNISVISKKKIQLVIYLCYIYIIIIDLNWGLHIWFKKQKIDLFLETKKFFLKEIEYVALKLSWELCLKINNLLVNSFCFNSKCLGLLWQCKEWGFLLTKLFGIHLGTGDYGHLVVDHSATLLRGYILPTIIGFELE